MKRLGDQTLYEILDVSHDANIEDVRVALERARTIYGPGSLATYTLMSPDEASFLSRRIEEAGVTLLDPEARARYDARLLSSVASHVTEEPLSSRSTATPLPLPAWGSFPPVIPALEQIPEEAPVREMVMDPSRIVDAILPAEALLPSSFEAKGEEVQLGEPLSLLSPASVTPYRPLFVEKPVPKVEPLVAAQFATENKEPDPVKASSPPGPPSRVPIRLDRPVTIPRAALTPPTRSEPRSETPMPSFGDAPWSGEMLRKVREARGIPIQSIAERTKVTKHHLENIEADRYSSLPAPVYLRGILFGLARELRLDGQRVSRSYLERMAAALVPPSAGPKRA